MPMSDMSETVENFIGPGRGRAPDPSVPMWILLSGASELAGLIPKKTGADGKAVTAYIFLNTHANPHDENGYTVYPNVDAIASILGINRDDKAKPYIDRLKALGAVDVITERRRGHRKNFYTLHYDPPSGYKGFTTRGQFYDWQNAKRAADAAEKLAKETKEVATKAKASSQDKKAAIDAAREAGLHSARLKNWSVFPAQQGKESHPPIWGGGSNQGKDFHPPKSGGGSNQGEDTFPQVDSTPPNRGTTSPQMGGRTSSIELTKRASSRGSSRMRRAPSVPAPRKSHCGQRECDPTTRRIYVDERLTGPCPKCG